MRRATAAFFVAGLVLLAMALGLVLFTLEIQRVLYVYGYWRG